MDATAGALRPMISVVIPARDAAPTLHRTLESLARQTGDESFEVLLVDDGSRDETPSIAAAHAPMVKVLRNTDSRGPGAARNLGASVARGSVLAFTDADCFPTDGWLTAGMASIRQGNDLVQGAVTPDPSVQRTPFDRTVQVTRDVGFYPTANLLVRREYFDAVGGFRDWLLEDGQPRPRRRWQPEDRRRQRAARTPIGEDTLFAWSARRRGARTAFAPDAIVHHAVVPGRLWDEVLDRWHWTRDMPGVARLIPELRDGYLYRRWFFSPKTAHFDLAATSVVIAAGTRRAAPLLGALPYARWIAIESRRFGGANGARHAAGSALSDAVTLAGLLIGSVSWRSPVV